MHREVSFVWMSFVWMSWLGKFHHVRIPKAVSLVQLKREGKLCRAKVRVRLHRTKN